MPPIDKRDTKAGAISRSLHTMTPACRFATMSSMRTVLIVATVAIGAVRIMWRAFSPPRIALPEEWAADE
jgi:hypothetical protein